MVSTKWCKGTQVVVYDSIFTKLVMRMFGLKRANDIIMMPIQKQEGSSDCGVLAISVMTSLVYDKDPCKIKYKRSDL